MEIRRRRARNPTRAAALEAGEKIYQAPPCFCGCTDRYVSNSQCVDCLIAKGKRFYATLSPEARAARKARDRARYVASRHES